MKIGIVIPGCLRAAPRFALAAAVGVILPSALPADAQRPATAKHTAVKHAAAAKHTAVKHLAAMKHGAVKPATAMKHGAVKPVADAAVSETGAKAAGADSYVETLPNSVVKLEMISAPAGTLNTAGKKIPIMPFWIANTETTWEAYDVFTGSGPASPAYDQTKFAADAIARPSKSYILPDLGWGHHGYPAINISYLSATMFCRWLSSVTGKKYRLPTDAEWEYACRAGAPTVAPLTKAQANERAWYADNADTTKPVAKKLPNAWKLYDMLGNVGEWATDAQDKPVLCGPTFKDSLSQLTPTMRRRQTPAWQATDPQLPKSRWWLSDGFFVGFRVVREP